MVLYAVLASLGHEGAIGTARDTLAPLPTPTSPWWKAQRGLPGVFCGQLHDAYFGTLQGDKTIRDFISLAETTLDAIVGDGAARRCCSTNWCAPPRRC